MVPDKQLPSDRQITEEQDHLEDIPPPYEAVAEELVYNSPGMRDDGRVDIDVNSRLVRTLSVLVPKKKLAESLIPEDTTEQPPIYLEEEAPIRLNIVIQVVGSRGDVQPFIALGCELLRYGHRVRLATHDVFADFVRASGLEFFPIGGDPSELMAYMVKNPGLVPSMQSLRAGDVQKKRKMVAEMLDGCWRSCVEPDLLTGRPFVAEAVIANPPSFAHVHCAQALGVPVHLVFTMPWTSTGAFCHPLANLVGGRSGGISPRMANYISYMAVEWMTWQGLGDIINSWRSSLDLEPVPFSEGPHLLETLQIPFTYCWSPTLVPKPADWPAHIDVCGFFFREAPSYTPEPELEKFLQVGPPPVYIGFGSIVLDKPEKLTQTLLTAVRETGVRAIISKGWSKLGEGLSQSEDVLFLGDCPHEWLFQHVAAVVHHGGAGTTACGLLNGKPTTIVPFFGDQPFWGDMVAAAGAGPKPIPQTQLDSTNLANAIRYCLTPEASAAAQTMAEKMRAESGVKRAVASFHANLPLEAMRCDILPKNPAVWRCRKGGKVMKLSNVAAGVLTENLRMDWKDFKRYESKSIYIDLRRWDPVSATTSSLMATGTGMATSAADIVIKPIQAFQKPKKDPSSAVGEDGSDENNPQPSTGRTRTTPASSNTAVTAVVGVASGVGGLMKHFSKGMLTDMPLAVSEGMRVAPRFYGGEVYEPGPVTDWKSGGIAAGKNFSHGVIEGLGGLVTGPIRGAKKEGAAGAAKGVGIGLLNMGTKFSSGVVGLVGFSGQGIYKSVRSAMHQSTNEIIKVARRSEAIGMAESERFEEAGVVVLREFAMKTATGK